MITIVGAINLDKYNFEAGADTGFFQGYDIIHNIYFFMDWIGLDCSIYWSWFL